MVEFEVSSDEGLVDGPMLLRLVGLPAGSRVTLPAATHDGLGRTWSSWASFDTDGSGILEVGERKPLCGTYSEPDPMGLFWSMVLDPCEETRSFFGADVTSHICVRLNAEMEGEVVASVELARGFLAPGVSRTLLREGGLAGVYFRPVTGPSHR